MAVRAHVLHVPVAHSPREDTDGGGASFQQEKKGVANFERQTWDNEHYERRAQLRASGQLPEAEVCSLSLRCVYV